jgi:RimJ/RimL family protein N-acetyltransferase/GNAT superfamily N-acetyltransferase
MSEEPGTMTGAEIQRPVARLPDGRSLVGRVIRLDEAVQADAAALFTALDDERVYRYGYGGGPAGRPDTPEPIEAAIAAARTDASRTMYVVRLTEDSALGAAGAVVGTSTLGDAVPVHRRIHIGWTGYTPAVWATAVNPECKLLLLGLAFDLGYGRVKIQTDLINERSQAAIAKLGAVREGVLRHHQIRADGSWRDTVVFSILAEEWPSVRDRLTRRVVGGSAAAPSGPGPSRAETSGAQTSGADTSGAKSSGGQTSGAQTSGAQTSGAQTSGAEPTSRASSVAVALQGALRASIAASAERVGPFLVTFSPDSDIPPRNYAIPDDGATPTRAEVDALVAAFLARGRLPHLEMVVPAPGAEAALADAGFVIERRLPLLVHGHEPGDGGARDDAGSGDVTAALVTDEDDLRTAATIQHVAYEGSDDIIQADIDRLARTIRSGGGVALGWLHGVPVGSGVFVPPAAGFSELAAVGVLPRARRHGVAAAVTRALTAGAAATGATPFLQAEDSETARIYQRAGYRIVGEIAMVSLLS